MTTESLAARQRSISSLIALGLLALIVAYVLSQFFLRPERYQWDFRVYYYAAAAHQAGVDPYNPDEVRKVAPGYPLLPFTYPPPLLHFFGLFTSLPFEIANYVWLGIKMAALGYLMLLWRRELFRQDASLPYALFMLLGFSSAIYIDLIAGNTSIIEQALLWTGFIFLLRQRPVLFAVFVALAASFKLMPIAFLSLLVLVPGPRRWKHVTIALGVFAGLVSFSYLMEPGLFGRFVDTAWGIRERGLDGNSSMLALLQDLVEETGLGQMPNLARWLPLGIYVAAAFAILWGSLRAWQSLRKLGDSGSLVLTLLLACLTYALIVPRFKTYSLILLLPAAWYAFKRSAGLSVLPLLVALFAIPAYPRLPNEYPIHIFGKYVWLYYPLILEFTLWWLLLRLIARVVGECGHDLALSPNP